MNNINILNKSGGRSGFTLIEILLVMGIIAILASVVIVAINPGRQFALARNSQRTSNVFAILNAISQNISDNNGIFVCSDGNIPTEETTIKADGGYDLVSCVVPAYLPELPFDPSAESAHYTSDTDYDTAYLISKDSVTGRITISAPEALKPSELNKTISATR